MDKEVKALKSELALLKLQFSERVADVENRLNDLLIEDELQTTFLKIKPIGDDVLAETVIPVNKQVLHNELPPSQISKPTTEFLKELPSEPPFSEKNGWQAPVSASPSFIMLFFKTLLSSLFDWFSPVTDIYQSYKDRGMLGIFILTVVGIGLTLAGFGYLMQLLIDQLGAGAKSIFMGGAAISVMGAGIALKIKTRFSEFATAIVTLGMLLSYSSVYFTGSVYGLIPNFTIVILYLCIALLCHVIAVKLDTKVVAALGIIGIATMPLLSNTLSIEPLYYLLSLAFVVTSSLFLAFRYVGQWLAQLSLAFVLISLEWAIGFENVVISAWLVNLLYLLFFAYITATLLKSKMPSKQSLIFLTSLVGATVIVFFQASDIFTISLSSIFILNMLISMGVAILLYMVRRELMPIFILLAATWALLAIVSAVSDAYWGIAWAIEGLLLLFIGRRYNILSTVTQGQILTAIALVYSWAALAMYFPLPALKSLDGWMLSMMIVVIIAVWQRLINTAEVFDEVTQNTVKPFLQLIEIVWVSILFIASANIWLGHWAGVSIIFLQLVLLFRAKKCQQVSIEIFAAILFIIPLLYAYKGAILVDSFRFTLLPLFAKLSVVSAFIQLWLWSAYYRKYQPDSSIKYFAESARIFFYILIPICWLGSLVRHFDEKALLFLWLSPLIALFLARKVNHHLLIKEAKILTGLASVAFVIVIGQLTLFNSLIVLVGFSSFYLVAYMLNRKEANHIYQFICSWGLLSLGLAIPHIIVHQTGNLFYGAIFAGLYWSALMNMSYLSSHLKSNEMIITVINMALVVGAWLLIPSNTYYVLLPLIFLMAAIYQKEQRFMNSLLAKSFKLNSDIFLHSIAAISYLTLLTSLTNYQLDLIIAPVLAVHGALILFLKDRRLATVKYSFVLILLGIGKLALIDAANALLWQKVILFMGVGVFILAASFWYQKLVSHVAIDA
jgi:hypothetical protein